MGQVWAIVDLTLMRCCADLCKLGESLWDSFSWLESYIQARSQVNFPNPPVLGPSKIRRGVRSQAADLRHVPMVICDFHSAHFHNSFTK